jgi:hypothetical protein
MKNPKINSSANIVSFEARKKLQEKRQIKFGFLSKYLTVEGAAYRMKCSTRRVRQLLQQVRLAGSKVGKDWQVDYPITLQIGQRGPKNKFFTSSPRGFESSDLRNQVFLNARNN